MRAKKFAVVANVNATTATIALHDTNIEDSTIKIVTIDLEQHLWREVHQLLKFYHEDNRIAELAISILIIIHSLITG